MGWRVGLVSGGVLDLLLVGHWDRDLDLFLVVCWTYFGIHPCTLEGYGLNVSISQEDMNME